MFELLLESHIEYRELQPRIYITQRWFDPAN